MDSIGLSVLCLLFWPQTDSMVLRPGLCGVKSICCRTPWSTSLWKYSLWFYLSVFTDGESAWALSATAVRVLPVIKWKSMVTNECHIIWRYRLDLSSHTINCKKYTRGRWLALDPQHEGCRSESLCLDGFSSGTCRDSKLAVGVSVKVNGCLPLYVGSVMDWRTGWTPPLA